MYKAESCKICGQSIKLYDCEKCYGLCERSENKADTDQEVKEIKENKADK